MPTENCNISTLRDQICVDISLRHNVMAEGRVRQIPLSQFNKKLSVENLFKKRLREIASLGKSILAIYVSLRLRC